MNYPIILHTNKKAVNGTEKFSPFKTGKSESFFEYKLDKYFREILFTEEKVKDNTNWFQPDYLIKILHGDIYIDIEVDEPYAFGAQFKPIHQAGDDDERNEYFLDKGWDVIRFTEQQIAKFPNACCKVISEHLYHRTQDHIWIENFSSVPDLEEEPVFELEQTRKKFQFRHRDSYQPFIINRNDDAPISILIDGVYLDRHIKWLKNIYRVEYPKKDFSKPAKAEPILRCFADYFYKFDFESNLEIVDINMYVFISSWHSLTQFDIGQDNIQFDNYNINLFFIRTDKLICFEINDYAIDRIGTNIILVADDPAYNLFLNEWQQKGKQVIVFSPMENMEIPDGFNYASMDKGIALGIGLEEFEI